MLTLAKRLRKYLANLGLRRDKFAPRVEVDHVGGFVAITRLRFLRDEETAGTLLWGAEEIYGEVMGLPKADCRYLGPWEEAD